MRYTSKYFRDSLPGWKKKKDPILSRVFYRPASFYFSALFSNIGWTANMVSYLSACVALVACVCFVFSHSIAGAVFINLWLVLDCADGNIARSVRKERYGDFADSMSSYICVGLMFACMGYAACQQGGLLFSAGDFRIILIGALAGSSDSLMRLLFQKYLNSSLTQGLVVNRDEDPEKQRGINRIRMKVDAYVSLGGFLPLAVLLGGCFGCLDIVCCLWCAYYGLTFFASTSYLVMKTFKVNRDVCAEDIAK